MSNISDCVVSDCLFLSTLKSHKVTNSLSLCFVSSPPVLTLSMQKQNSFDILFLWYRHLRHLLFKCIRTVFCLFLIYIIAAQKVNYSYYAFVVCKDWSGPEIQGPQGCLRESEGILAYCMCIVITGPFLGFSGMICVYNKKNALWPY